MSDTSRLFPAAEARARAYVRAWREDIEEEPRTQDCGAR